MYTMSQKLNNLEEKISVLDTFSQSIYNYISSKEEKEKEDIITYSNQVDIKEQEKLIKQKLSESLNGLMNKQVFLPETQNETESNQYTVPQPVNQFEDKLTENFESKEVLSEMVSQLKETLIEENTVENVGGKEDNVENKVENEPETKPDELYNLLNNTFNTESNNVKEYEQITLKEDKNVIGNKKKEEELMKMKIQDLKNLAKKKNIKLLDQTNKPKKKENLVMELLNQS